MSLKGHRIGFFAFFLLSAGVAINLLFLQPNRMGAVSVADVRPQATPALLETASVNRAAQQRSADRSQTRKITPPGTDLESVLLNRSSGTDNLMPGQVGLRDRFLPVNTGNSAELIRAIQRELKAKGYDPGAEDGAAGLVTRAAIFAYQYDHNLDVTAAPSEALLQTLVLGGGGQPAGLGRRSMELTGEARDLVLATQRGLKQQRLWPSPVDGHFDTTLSRAIQQFETAQRMPTTGRISGRFMARLARLSGVGRLAKSR